MRRGGQGGWGRVTGGVLPGGGGGAQRHRLLRQRHRLLRHLTDRRRTRCQQTVLAMGLPSLPEAELQRLDAQTRKLAATSRREGHSHPLASGTALTATGKRIGHALSA